MGGCSFEQDGVDFYIVGADAVRKKLTGNDIYEIAYNEGNGWAGKETIQLDVTNIPDYATLSLDSFKYVALLSSSGTGGATEERTNMLEVLNADYIRTARAKGLSERTVIYKHAFRNTLIPLVTIIGGSLPGLFSGALITESLFSIPGIGYISYQSMVAGDIPFTMFYLSFMAVLTLASNLLTDILYGVVDPRVRIS